MTGMVEVRYGLRLVQFEKTMLNYSEDYHLMLSKGDFSSSLLLPSSSEACKNGQLVFVIFGWPLPGAATYLPNIACCLLAL